MGGLEQVSPEDVTHFNRCMERLRDDLQQVGGRVGPACCPWGAGGRVTNGLLGARRVLHAPAPPPPTPPPLLRLKCRSACRAVPCLASACPALPALQVSLAVPGLAPEPDVVEIIMQGHRDVGGGGQRVGDPYLHQDGKVRPCSMCHPCDCRRRIRHWGGGLLRLPLPAAVDSLLPT